MTTLTLGYGNKFTGMEAISRYYTDGTIPSHEEMVELVRLAKNGDEEARFKVIEGSLRFIIKNLTDTGIGRNTMLPIGDLIGEAVVGVHKAIDKFDPEKGSNFLTYAVYWINIHMQEAARKTHCVPMSKNYHRFLSKLRQYVEDGKTPDNLNEISEITSIPLKTIRGVFNSSSSVISLDESTGETDDSPTLYEVLEGKQNIEHDIEKHDIYAIIRDFVKELPEREQKIISLRFGLSGDDPMTLGEIGAVVGLTNERVRQIQETILVELRERFAEEGCSEFIEVFVA